MLFILLLFVSAGLKAQFYEYGQDAGSLKWYYFKTPHFSVIHPAGIDSLGAARGHEIAGGTWPRPSARA